MKKILFLFLTLILASSLALAIDTKISGEFDLTYRGPNNNHVNSGAFGPWNTYLNTEIVINKKATLTTKSYLSTDLELYFLEYNLNYITDIDNLSFKIGVQEMPLAQYYTNLITATFLEGYKSYDFGIVANYKIQDLTIKTGIFNSSAYWAGSPDNNLSYSIQTIYDAKSWLPSIDMLEVTAGGLKDPSSSAMYTLGSKLTAYKTTAIVEYAIQNEVNHSGSYTNDNTLNIGLAYQLTPALETAAEYTISNYNSLNPKITSLGLNYKLDNQITLRAEGVIPQYDGLSSYSDNRYYVLALNCKF
jgi:hypothetical protein